MDCHMFDIELDDESGYVWMGEKCKGQDPAIRELDHQTCDTCRGKPISGSEQFQSNAAGWGSSMAE
jgi:hypothetical protein